MSRLIKQLAVYTGIGAGSFLFFVLLFFALSRASATSAVLRFQPNSGTVAVGSSLTIKVQVNTNGEDINAAAIVINYPSDLLSLQSVNTSQSIFDQWVIQDTSTLGIINYQGGSVTTYQGSSGLLLTLSFTGVSPGTANLTFGLESEVSAADGFGTNILDLAGSSGGVYTITANSSATPTPTSAPTPTVAPSSTATPTTAPVGGTGQTTTPTAADSIPTTASSGSTVLLLVFGVLLALAGSGALVSVK